MIQFESFHWLSHHELCAILLCSTNTVSARVNFGAFLLLFQSSLQYFGGIFNKTAITLALLDTR